MAVSAALGNSDSLFSPSTELQGTDLILRNSSQHKAVFLNKVKTKKKKSDLVLIDATSFAYAH